MRKLIFGFLLGFAIIVTTHAAMAAPSDDFVITVKTDNPGTSAPNEFIVLTTGILINYNVDLNNDGSWDYVGVTGNTVCVFATPGTYVVRIGGTFPAIYFNYTGDNQKLLTVEQWGSGVWESMEAAFYNCSNLVINACDTPNLSNVRRMTNMFFGARSMNQAIDTWDTTNVTSMTGMFMYASSFNQPIGNWNTSNTVEMRCMFYGADLFNQPIGNWNTGNVTDMSYMFYDAYSFNQPIGNWDTHNVTDMNTMFCGAQAFNQAIGGWNTSNVVNMERMFFINSGFNQPIGDWDTGKVVKMNSMFFYASSFNQDIGHWNTCNVKTMSNMFCGADAFDQNLGSWVVDKLEDATLMFGNCTLSTTNYDALLLGWSIQNLKLNVHFSAGNSNYSHAAVSARTDLITMHGWMIDDGGCVTPTPTATITSTPFATVTLTPTQTESPATTRSPTRTLTPTGTSPILGSATPTVTPTLTLGYTVTYTPKFDGNNLGGRELIIYPNPGKSKISFAFQSDTLDNHQLRIYNANGERVADLRFLLVENNRVHVVWDCNLVAPGIYLARVIRNGKEIGKAKLAVIR